MFIDYILLQDLKRIKKINSNLRKYNLLIERYKEGFCLRCKTCRKIIIIADDYKTIDTWKDCKDCNNF